MVKLQKEQRKRPEKENRDRRNSDQDYKEPDLEANRDMRHIEKRKSSSKIDDFGVHSGVPSHGDKDSLKSELIFWVLLGQLVNITILTIEYLCITDMYIQEFTFCEKVKDRLRSQDDYQAFLKCLHIFSTEIITRKELQSLVCYELATSFFLRTAHIPVSFVYTFNSVSFILFSKTSIYKEESFSLVISCGRYNA